LRRGHTLAKVSVMALDALQWCDIADPTRAHDALKRAAVGLAVPQLCRN
jgi:hypothetical protein